MLIGAHAIIYSTKPDADRDFLRDVLKLSHVDVGHGWLIFAMPPSEAAFHPDEKNGKHELYFMCDDLKSTMESLRSKKVEYGPVHEERWGSLTSISLPGGGKIGLYQPKHPTAIGR